MGVDQDYREIPLTWERGLVETVEDSMLPPGSAAVLKNWVADTSGNLRARPGWSKGSTTSAPATRKGRGIGVFPYESKTYETVTLVQSDHSLFTATSGTVTWPGATTAGNTLVVVVYTVAATDIDISTSSWNDKVTLYEDVSGTDDWAVFVLENAPSQSGNVTITGLSGVQTTQALLLEYSGLAMTDVVDTAFWVGEMTETSGGSQVWNWGTTTENTEDGVLLIAAAFAGTATWGTVTGWTNGFTERIDVPSASGSAAMADLSVSAIDGWTTQFTLGNTTDPNAAILFSLRRKALTQSNASYFLVADDTTDDYGIYYIDGGNLSAGTWTLLETVAGSDSANSLVAFAPGLRKIFYTNQFWATARQWARGDPSALTGSPAGRCIAFHKNRLFIGGTIQDPSRLYYSEVGDETIWDSGTAGSIAIADGDGEPVEDIVPFEDGLLIGKQTSLWFLSGSGPDTFRLIRIPTGGCAPGRTLLATEFGAIVAGRTEVHLYTNGAAQLISRPVRDSYGLTGTWMTSSVRDESAYICDGGSGKIWVIDFASGGTWREENIHDTSSTEGSACIYNYLSTQLYAPKNASIGSLLNYRTIPGSSRTKDFDTLSEKYEAWTPEMWLVGPEEKMTPRYLFMKIRQRGGDAGDGVLNITAYYDGTAGTAMTITPAASAGVRWYRKSLGEKQGISSLQLRFSQTLASTDAAVLDIEEITVGYNVEKYR